MVPSPARPLFQAAVANFVPGSEAKIDVEAKRGPLLITGGEHDGIVPEVTSRGAFELYAKASTVNDYKGFDGCGHSLCIDAGRREVAEHSIDWLGAQGF